MGVSSSGPWRLPRRGGGEIPVLAGVNAGDALVVKGQAALRDGEAVRTGP